MLPEALVTRRQSSAGQGFWLRPDEPYGNAVHVLRTVRKQTVSKGNRLRAAMQRK